MPCHWERGSVELAPSSIPSTTTRPFRSSASASNNPSASRPFSARLSVVHRQIELSLFPPFVEDIAKDTASRPHPLLVPSLRVTPLSYPNPFFCAFYASAVRSVKIPFTVLPGCDFRQFAIDDW